MKKNKIYSGQDYDFEQYGAAESGENKKKYLSRIKNMLRESSSSSPSFIENAKKAVPVSAIAGGAIGAFMGGKRGALIGGGLGSLTGAGAAALRTRREAKDIKSAKELLLDRNIDKKILNGLEREKKQRMGSW